MSRHNHQTATYWGEGQLDGFAAMTHPAPVQIKVRWQDTQKLFIDDMGEQLLSRSIVYCQQPVAVGGYLYLGVSTEANPTGRSGAHRIKAVSITPNLSNTKQEVKAWL